MPKIKALMESSGPTPEVPPQIPEPLAELRRVYLLYLEALEPTAERLAPERLGPVTTSALQISTSLQQAGADRLLPWLQAIESNVPPANRPAFSPTLKLDELAAQFNALETATADLAAVPLECKASSEQLRSMLVTKRAPLPEEGSLAKLDEYRAAARALDIPLQKNDGCSELLRSATKQLVSWLLQYPPTSTAPSSGESILLTDLHDHVSAYLEQIQRFSSALETARTLSASEEKASATMARIGQFLDRRDRLGSGLDPAIGVLPVPHSSFSGKAVVWSKKRTDTVEVAVDESLKEKLILRHPVQASGTIEVRRAFTDGLEADFGLTKTELFSSKFEAKDLDGEDGGPSQIQETDRETRSGKVAIMAAYRFPFGAGFAFGPQVGVGIDTADAALFYGVSLRWRFLSIGYGRTRQRVTALRGQEVGQELAAGVSLQTMDDFATDNYWSLAITIKDLPFFQPPASE